MRRVGLVAAGAIVVHTAAAHALDRGALVERMLSPGGDDVALAAGITGAFLILRLAVLFVLPGWILARVVLEAVRIAGRRS